MSCLSGALSPKWIGMRDGRDQVTSTLQRYIYIDTRKHQMGQMVMKDKETIGNQQNNWPLDIVDSAGRVCSEASPLKSGVGDAIWKWLKRVDPC